MLNVSAPPPDIKYSLYILLYGNESIFKMGGGGGLILGEGMHARGKGQQKSAFPKLMARL